MLTLTENAQTVISGIVSGAEAPQTGGIRISQDVEGAGLAVAVANQPEADDQVVESAGAKVFLDPQAAVALDDKVLDASAQPDGRVDFAIGQQG
ncbi:Fe-S cluster assembly protein HesB [Agrococcus carbonis]|uniref:Fe-S cluster assembly iron-binding protein IscA n=1 Tax=Agrococcus carbonis TaxID=684552 RepID=A0A1H1PET0_9MICO|nr:Fe-S cluster assembly protein HesB [Agrococcus carbonis]SDS09766.1 Fe-S cluster assembly iron-binding protein IscA [Agrococcus carbonis]